MFTPNTVTGVKTRTSLWFWTAVLVSIQVLRVGVAYGATAPGPRFPAPPYAEARPVPSASMDPRLQKALAVGHFFYPCAQYASQAEPCQRAPLTISVGSRGPLAIPLNNGDIIMWSASQDRQITKLRSACYPRVPDYVELSSDASTKLEICGGSRAQGYAGATIYVSSTRGEHVFMHYYIAPIWNFAGSVLHGGELDLLLSSNVSSGLAPLLRLYEMNWKNDGAMLHVYSYSKIRGESITGTGTSFLSYSKPTGSLSTPISLQSSSLNLDSGVLTIGSGGSDRFFATPCQPSPELGGAYLACSSSVAEGLTHQQESEEQFWNPNGKLVASWPVGGNGNIDVLSLLTKRSYLMLIERDGSYYIDIRTFSDNKNEFIGKLPSFGLNDTLGAVVEIGKALLVQHITDGAERFTLSQFPPSAASW